MKKIILIPLSFPYDKYQEESFLQYEIEYIKKYFGDFVILPFENAGLKASIEQKFIVDESFSEYNRTKKRGRIAYLFRAIFSRYFLYEIASRPTVLLHSSELIRRLSFVKNAIQTISFFKHYYNLHCRKEDKIVFYTYWTTHITFALGILARRNRNISVITRMHGFDLYEERGYVACQKQIIENVKKIYFVSCQGKNYILEKYAEFKEKFRLAPIGVKRQSKLNPWSLDEKLRIVSCSVIDENKRVIKIFESLLSLAKTGQIIEWVHFGSGNKEQELRSEIDLNQNNNLKCILMGKVSSDCIISYYENNEVDLFITLSASEGGRPVSIQEALSFGIPVIATNVGGIPEIVDAENGLLLQPDVDAAYVAECIKIIFKDKLKLTTMRQHSLLNWSKLCDKDVLFDDFCSEVYNLF